MKKNILLVITIVSVITGCGGGGGGPNPPSPTPTPTANLVPLKIAMLDLNNNPIAYFDVSKIGSHPIHKLQFTNPNSISIDLYFTAQEYYATVQAQKMSISVDDYVSNYQPVAYAYGVAVKTSNADDCFNHLDNGSFRVLLTPGESCSYYTYSANIAMNHTTKDTFTVPVSYTIADHNSAVNNLDVVQCSRSGMPPNPYIYDCSNMSKPGFSEQFITYKALPINGSSNFLPFNPYGHMISLDGNWYWSCTTTSCNKYALNYNSTTNTLIQSTTFTTTAITGVNSNIAELYITPDGSSVWVSSYSNDLGYALVNTSNPNLLFDDGGWGRYVPDMDTTSNLFTNGVVGLDGSFWWQTGVAADIYNPITQNFVRTNIDGIAGVNADGTVIGFRNKQGACFDRGPDYTSYIYRGPLLNYSPTEIGASATNHGNNVYMLMYVKEALNYSGVGLGLKALYKVHTENGKCEINLDDYTYIIGASNQYDLSGANGSDAPFLVGPISDVYSGL
jgi:hypothetical protein